MKMKKREYVNTVCIVLILFLEEYMRTRKNEIYFDRKIKLYFCEKIFKQKKREREREKERESLNINFFKYFYFFLL